MDPYQYEFCNRRLSIRQGQVGHTDEKLVGITAKDQQKDVMAFVKPEDAPAVALAILEAAGIDNSASRHLAAAWRNLNRHVSERKQEAEREAEAAKVREFVEAIPGVSYLDESPEHWQVLYRAAREFFNREASGE